MLCSQACSCLSHTDQRRLMLLGQTSKTSLLNLASFSFHSLSGLSFFVIDSSPEYIILHHFTNIINILNTWLIWIWAKSRVQQRPGLLSETGGSVLSDSSCSTPWCRCVSSLSLFSFRLQCNSLNCDLHFPLLAGTSVCRTLGQEQLQSFILCVTSVCGLQLPSWIHLMCCSIKSIKKVLTGVVSDDAHYVDFWRPFSCKGCDIRLSTQDVWHTQRASGLVPVLQIGSNDHFSYPGSMSLAMRCQGLLSWATSVPAGSWHILH